MLERLEPTLLRAGGAGLAWCRVRDSIVSPRLSEAFSFHEALGIVWRDVTSDVGGCLRKAGVTALFAKGWTLARDYPGLGCRPYGDVDVLVAPADHARAAHALESAGLDRHVDLHVRWDGLGSSTFHVLHARSRIVACEGEDLAVLGLEDELRYLCVHYAKHGGARPLWLCDVGLAIDSAVVERGFDSARMLGPPARVRRTVLAVMNLAVTVLGAREQPCARGKSPAWLIDDTLSTWLHRGLHPVRALAVSDLRHLPGSLRERFPNALRATYALGASYERGPRLPLRVAAFALRGAELLLERLRDEDIER